MPRCLAGIFKRARAGTVRRYHRYFKPVETPCPPNPPPGFICSRDPATVITTVNSPFLGVCDSLFSSAAPIFTGELFDLLLAAVNRYGHGREEYLTMNVSVVVRLALVLVFFCLLTNDFHKHGTLCGSNRYLDTMIPCWNWCRSSLILPIALTRPCRLRTRILLLKSTTRHQLTRNGVILCLPPACWRGGHWLRYPPS